MNETPSEQTAEQLQTTQGSTEDRSTTNGPAATVTAARQWRSEPTAFGGGNSCGPDDR